MSCRKRPTAHLIGAALVMMLGASCTEEWSLFSTGPTTTPQTAIVDHALNAARSARASGDLNSAAARLAYLVSIAPDNTGVLSEYAKVLTELGRPDDALVYFRKAMARDANDWKLYNAEAVAYDEKHDYAAAGSDYESALKLSPGQAVVINNAARSRMAAGDLKGAEAMLAQASAADRAQGFLVDTQSHLTALEVAQNAGVPLAVPAADKAASQNATTLAAAESPVAAPVAPVEARSATATPVSLMTDTAGAADKQHAADTQPAPAAQTATPLASSASVAPPPAPQMQTEPVMPPVANSSAPASVEIAPTQTDSVVLPAPSPATTPATPEAAQTQPAPVVLNKTPSQTPVLSPPADPAATAKPPAMDQANAVGPMPAALPSASTPASAGVPPSASPLASKDEPKALPVVVDAKPVASQSALAEAKPASSSRPAARTDNHRYYIRVGTYRSRKHARHVAARLRSRAAVHIARLRYHGHRYYRVWFASAGGPVEAETRLQSIHSLGFRHARVIAKLQATPERRLADALK